MNSTLIERNVFTPETFPQATLEFAVKDRGHLIVIQVRGEATCDLAGDLDERVRSSLKPGTQFVVLDLAGLTLIGPTALAMLADISRDLSRKGGEVWLAGLQPAVWLALHDAGLDRLFTIRSSLAEALA
jgi:anti-anti-sigma factor